MQVPLFISRPGEQPLPANRAGITWLAVHEIDPGKIGFDNLFLPTESGGMSAMIRAVLERGVPRTARFYHIAHGGNEPFDFVFSPCTVDGMECVCLQPVGYKGFRPGGDEGGLDLNLLVKERTAEISELNGFLGAIVDSSTETFIIAIGTNGTVLSFNEGACRMFLYPRNEVVGRIYASQLYSPEEQAQHTWEEMERSAKVQGKSRRTVTLQRRDGSTFPALVDLTPREFGLLELMMSHPRQVFTREQMLNRVWGYDWVGDTNVVEVHISSLRDKLGDAERQIIRTVRGVGYTIKG